MSNDLYKQFEPAEQKKRYGHLRQPAAQGEPTVRADKDHDLLQGETLHYARHLERCLGTEAGDLKLDLRAKQGTGADRYAKRAIHRDHRAFPPT
jgi:hypothetical protein